MLDDYEELKRKVARLRQRKDEGRGREKQMAAWFKKTFGVSTPEAARKVVEKLGDGERAIAVKYSRRKKKIEKDYRKELDDA